ncbi:MAG: tetratricopeptide repeat protein [Deltaproteobacteria bacterium]
MRKSSQGLCVLLLAVFVAGCSAAPVKEQRPYIMTMAEEASASGAAAYANGDFAKAAVRFGESLRMNRSVDNRGGELVDLINIGRATVELGDARSAVAMLEDALRLAALLKDEAALSEGHATIAKAHQLAGESPTALDHIEQSILIDARLGRRSGTALNLKGLIYLSAGRRQEAGPILAEALKLNTNANDSVQAANSMRALAEFERESGDLKEAYAYLERAYKADKSTASSGRIALDLEMMADIRVIEGRRADGAFLYERSYLVSLSNGQTSKAISRIEKLIKTYMDIGDVEKARFYTAIRDGILAGQDNSGRYGN